ncbi:hypothetical protein BGW36DRAFT_431884 [Talaromyces proteolyticus]|uniref:Uncharacterized protein n=1 Tax=Talaromyces proteolyticus TaxID=1131652 RepID=A0AAD4KG60_9EURO|nr:uncharacterized protein BGW36DRAFT_431884 [Talaromyces proteolyticus]KAH8691334.1 hypothetical protein BGW36DRAFT_431884 [Talaromyces proteolyticus]
MTQVAALQEVYTLGVKNLPSCLISHTCLDSSVQNSHITDKDCIQQLSSYTPALDAIEYFDINFYDALSDGGKYRGPPTADLDQNWHELWQHEAIMVDTQAMFTLNRTHFDLYEKVDSEMSDGFTAMLKVHQQLGCLDIIRQYTWFLDGKYPKNLIPLELQKPPDQNRMHVDRCIEDLRISLMCYGDMTPLLITKDRDPDSGFKVELNSHHKCRNFTKLQEWTRIHGVEHWENGGGFHQHGDRL